MHYNIVALDAWHVPIPLDLFNITSPDSYTLKIQDVRLKYRKEIHDCIHDATIIIVTTTQLDDLALSEDVTPNLRLIMVVASGTDNVNKEKCMERGIRVLNSPNCNSQSVAEHIIGLYFAARRRLIQIQNAIFETTKWVDKGTLSPHMDLICGGPPLSCKEEIAGIIGFGSIDQRTACLCRSLGMSVLIASRKRPPPQLPSGVYNSTKTSHEDNRTPFCTVLAKSTVLILCLPRTAETIDMVSTDEFRAMSRKTILINVSRGGIVDELALIKALKERIISSAATEVFDCEPSGTGRHWREGDSALLRLNQKEAEELNLIMTPHVAWYSRTTMTAFLKTLKDNIEEWCREEVL